MKNYYILLFNLPSLSTHLSERLKNISTSINKLKLKDVETDLTFEQTKNRIKNEILLQEVFIEEPEFVDFEYEEIPLRFEQQMFGNVSKDHFYHEISFKFTGSKELFMHSADNFSFSSSDHGIIEPNNNSVKVIVDLPEMNPIKAIAEAKNLFRLTENLAKQNSKSIASWNLAVEKKINDDLAVERMKIIEMFGSNP